MTRWHTRRIAPTVWLLGVFALAVAVRLASLFLGPQLTVGAKPAGFVLLAIWILGAGAFGYLHWRALDETAREAHKAAWYWGGSFGLALAALAMVGVMFAPGAGDALLDYANANHGHIHPATFAVILGFMLCCLAQLLGYGLAWARWWLTRRN